MEIILKEDVEKLGNKGEVVEVADGYARNYLLPKGLAVFATKENLNQLKQQLKKEERKEEERREEAQEIADKLSELELEFAVKAGEEGRLFGSVTDKDIAESIEEEISVEIDKKDIKMDDNIKELGAHKIEIDLYKDIKAELKVKVIEA